MYGDVVNGCGGGTLARSREQHLGLQPDRPISVHHCCGCGVGKADEVLPLLLLHRVHDEMKSKIRPDMGDDFNE